MKKRILAVLLALTLTATQGVYILAEEETQESSSDEREEPEDREEEDSDEGDSEDYQDDRESQEDYIPDDDNGSEDYNDSEGGEGYSEGGFEGDTFIGEYREEMPAEDFYQETGEPEESYIEAPEDEITEDYSQVEEEVMDGAAEDDFQDIDYEEDEDFSLLDHYGLAASGCTLPGLDDPAWDSYPAFWEYNWDNTANATQWGLWGGNGNLQGYVAPSVADLNARHKMQMYCDGQNIHLRITYASVFDNAGNGDDYMFFIDGVQTKFQVVYDDNGGRLTEKRDPGKYTVQIRHENNSGSWDETLGAYGTMTVHEGQLNNITEIVIPVSEMGKQNPNVNTETYSMIEFFTPNLMMSRIGTGGASSGPVPFTVMTVLFFAGAYFSYRKKGRLLFGYC